MVKAPGNHGHSHPMAAIGSTCPSSLFSPSLNVLAMLGSGWAESKQGLSCSPLKD